MNMPTLPSGWPYERSPFHPAELALQERFGHRQTLDVRARRTVRGVLIEQHRQFYAQLPFILVGSVDATGQPWASMLAGHPGFVHSPDAEHLRFDGVPIDGDPVKDGLALGAPVGVLGVQPSTRRRNRISGRVSAVDERGFTVEVVQSYGNCPQYIQSRVLDFLDSLELNHEIIRADRLNQADRALLERSDTFYIATVNPNSADGVASGADVSHRGGRPGFVRIDDNQTITTPDFLGNFMFNTLGNLMVEPRAGLLFADFNTGDLLFAAARAEIIWDGPEVEAFAAAQRLMRFHLTKVIRLPGALPFRAKPDVEYARELAATGTWAEAGQALAGQQARTIGGSSG
jgi:predicted pyridoxine 5'-phosphate oxidase superfamily flavin-nucleotide-binding protein